MLLAICPILSTAGIMETEVLDQEGTLKLSYSLILQKKKVKARDE